MEPGSGRSAAGRRRVGVFGGTFNPVHSGHVSVAQAACSAARLDRMILVPSARPPHKLSERMPGFEHRLRMAELAAACDSRLGVSAVEGGRPGPSYTVDTLESLRSLEGADADLLLLIGSDTVPELRTWRNIGRIFEITGFIVAQRPGAEYDPGSPQRGLTAEQARILSSGVVVPVCSDVSSTEIRRRVSEGRPIAGMVPAPVEEYIRSRGLYRKRSGAGGPDGGSGPGAAGPPAFPPCC